MSSSTEKNVETDKSKGFQQDLEYLRQNPLFANLEFEFLKLLVMLSKKIELIEGDQLLVQDEDDGFSYYLISGKLTAYHSRNDRVYTLRSYEPGQFFGGMGLFGASSRLYTVEAVETSNVLRLHRDGFQKAVQRFPETMAHIVANMTAELLHWEKNRLSMIDDHHLEEGIQPLGISLL